MIQKSIDLSGMQLLGERQEKSLNKRSRYWAGAEMKAVLSKTVFCGAMHKIQLSKSSPKLRAKFFMPFEPRLDVFSLLFTQWEDKPNGKSLTGIVASQKDTAETREIEI